MPAKRFGNRWQNLGQLGEGGQSHVFLVKDLSGHYSDDCVLKRLKNINRIDRFEREIRAGIELEHPQIAPILDFSLDGDPYLVTKKYPGPVLTTLAPLALHKALEIFIEICDVVSYAHLRGVVHRDLKPDNIVLDEGGKPVVLDFGICYFEDEESRLTETMEQVGSRYFIAPELEGGRSQDVTWAVDSYSLGKILYFLLSSKLFAREAYTGSNDLAEILGNSQLNYVTQRILAKSVVESPTDRSTVSELKDISKTVKHLIQEHFYPGKVGSKCRFCGEGTYQKINNYSGLKGFVRVQTSRNTTGPSELFIDCESIVCDTCGNIQWFAKAD